MGGVSVRKSSKPCRDSAKFGGRDSAKFAGVGGFRGKCIKRENSSLNRYGEHSLDYWEIIVEMKAVERACVGFDPFPRFADEAMIIYGAWGRALNSERPMTVGFAVLDSMAAMHLSNCSACSLFAFPPAANCARTSLNCGRTALAWMPYL